MLIYLFKIILIWNTCSFEVSELLGDELHTIGLNAINIPKRIVRCEKCGFIGDSEYFATYGGLGRYNTGICFNCSRG